MYVDFDKKMNMRKDYRYATTENRWFIFIAFYILVILFSTVDLRAAWYDSMLSCSTFFPAIIVYFVYTFWSWKRENLKNRGSMIYDEKLIHTNLIKRQRELIILLAHSIKFI